MATGDASDSAYAGVIYLCAVYSDTRVSISLLLANTNITSICGYTTSMRSSMERNCLSKILVTTSNALSILLSDIYAKSNFAITLGRLCLAN